MNRLVRVIARLTVLLSFVLAATDCGLWPVATFQYRSVQSDFGNAVRLDNIESVDPFAKAESVATYREVADELTDEKIAELDVRLRGNAWMMRAVSEWRSGQFKEAMQSAEQGLRSGSIADHSRDQVLLTLLPALVIDSEIEEKWKAEDRIASVAAYDADDGYEANFKTALEQLDDTKRAIGTATPESVIFYYHYQKWRILQNWRQVIASINGEEADDPERDRARQTARTFLGGQLKDLAAQERKAIPDDSPLAKLIDAQE